MQVWPIQLRINELPTTLRNSRRYSLLAGLWCSKQKPSSFSFMEPTILSLLDMERKKLYGLQNCNLNIHDLRHLTFYVECLGPLWTHSAFSFEGKMFSFLKTSHASNGIEKQIVTTHLLHQRLCVERQRLLESNQHQTLRTLLANFQNSQWSMCSTEDISMLGKGNLFATNERDLENIY